MNQCEATPEVFADSVAEEKSLLKKSMLEQSLVVINCEDFRVKAVHVISLYLSM
jgi:hypothetical protein